MADGRVLVLDGRAAGQTLQFAEPVRIGSDPSCNLVIPELAPVHAMIEPVGEGYTMRVPSGAIVDGEPCTEVELPTIGKVDFGAAGVIFEQAGGNYRGKPVVRAAPTHALAPAGPRAVHSIGALVRARASTALVAIDGDVIMLAGGSPPMRGPAFATAELFSLARGAGHEVALAAARNGPTASLLADGRILIAGGGSTSAELFDLQTMTSTPTGSMQVQRSHARAVSLPNGLVVVFGGCHKPGSVAAEVYDPARGAWGGLRAPPLCYADIAALDEHRFLLAATASVDWPRPPATYYIFDSRNWKFEAIEGPPTPRTSVTLVSLGGGNVLVIGGVESASQRTTEWFELATNRFHPMRDMCALRGTPAVTRLATGRVLAVGGDSLATGLYSAEVFDPWTGVWTGLPAVWHGINAVGAIARSDGSAFVVGVGSVSLARDVPW